LPAHLLDECEHVVGLQWVSEHQLADVRSQIGQVEGQRKVTEVAQPFHEDDLLAGL
jgi:hypothetical protein